MMHWLKREYSVTGMSNANVVTQCHFLHCRPLEHDVLPVHNQSYIVDGIAVDIQGTDRDEVSWNTILDKAKKGTR